MQEIKLKTIDIKGRDYVTVHERIRVFRNDEKYSSYKLVTTPLKVDENIAYFEAQIRNHMNEVVANGHSLEYSNSSYINKTSHVENAETSAIGRALGSLGIGVDTSFATADEVLIAMSGQLEQKNNENMKAGGVPLNRKQASEKQMKYFKMLLPKLDKIDDDEDKDTVKQAIENPNAESISEAINILKNY